jgi:hypothetical protein
LASILRISFSVALGSCESASVESTRSQWPKQEIVGEPTPRWSTAQKGQSAFTSTLSLLQNTATFWKLVVRFKADL